VQAELTTFFVGELRAIVEDGEFNLNLRECLVCTMGAVLAVHHYEVPYLGTVLRHYSAVLYDLVVGPGAI
jgi:hypothetical protein